MKGCLTISARLQMWYWFDKIVQKPLLYFILNIAHFAQFYKRNLKATAELLSFSERHTAVIHYWTNPCLFNESSESMIQWLVHKDTHFLCFWKNPPTQRLTRYDDFSFIFRIYFFKYRHISVFIFNTNFNHWMKSNKREASQLNLWQNLIQCSDIVFLLHMIITLEPKHSLQDD